MAPIARELGLLLRSIVNDAGASGAPHEIHPTRACRKETFSNGTKLMMEFARAVNAGGGGRAVSRHVNGRRCVRAV